MDDICFFSLQDYCWLLLLWWWLKFLIKYVFEMTPCCQLHICLCGISLVNVLQFTFIAAVLLLGPAEINQIVFTHIKSNQIEGRLYDTLNLCWERRSNSFWIKLLQSETFVWTVFQPGTFHLRTWCIFIKHYVQWKTGTFMWINDVCFFIHHGPLRMNLNNFWWSPDFSSFTTLNWFWAKYLDSYWMNCHEFGKQIHVYISKTESLKILINMPIFNNKWVINRYLWCKCEWFYISIYLVGLGDMMIYTVQR